jgi:hypothetical protein
MSQRLTVLMLLLLAAVTATAQDDASEPADAAETENSSEEAAADAPEPVDPGGPKLMSGMSILGNEEAPKSLVIIPWKSSEIGDDLGLSDGFDDSARPVDKEVFLRELAFYKIRSGK